MIWKRKCWKLPKSRYPSDRTQLHGPVLSVKRYLLSDALPHKGGRAGFLSQSGQMAEDVGRYAALKGVFFSKAISYGNALDFNECDFLEYFASDPDTDIILMYVEGVRDGLRLRSVLAETTRTKPVIILKGGTGESGTRMTSSHTASMAGSHKIWQHMVRQAGAVSADNMEQLLDIAATFTHLPPLKGFNVGVAGGGGGSSVLAADQCEAAGLNVIPLPAEIREELKASGVRYGTGSAIPQTCPSGTGMILHPATALN